MHDSVYICKREGLTHCKVVHSSTHCVLKGTQDLLKPATISSEHMTDDTQNVQNVMASQTSMSVVAPATVVASTDFTAGAAETASKSIGNLVTLGLSAKMLRTSL